MRKIGHREFKQFFQGHRAKRQGFYHRSDVQKLISSNILIGKQTHDRFRKFSQLDLYYICLLLSPGSHVSVLNRVEDYKEIIKLDLKNELI